MKRALLMLVCAALFAFCAIGEEHGATPKKAETEHATEAKHGDAKHGEGAAHDAGDPLIWWKWANFAILAIILGYMLSKALPPFFASRTAEIQKGIADATKLRAEAEQRAAEMERRMSALGAEIEQIRTEAREQMAREGEKIQRESEHQLARIQAQAEQEVGAITKRATQQLKAEAARLALEAAEMQLRSRMDANAQAALVDRFVKQVDRQGVRA